MQVILLQNVKKVGEKGQVVNAADGFARNFLLKNKLAEIATPALIALAQQEQLRKKTQSAQAKEKVQALAKAISGRRIVIQAKAQGNKLFGAIGAKEIASALQKEGFEISEKSIGHISIKTLGETELAVALEGGIRTTIKVAVEKI